MVEGNGSSDWPETPVLGEASKMVPTHHAQLLQR